MPRPRAGSEGNSGGNTAPRDTRMASEVDAADNEGMGGGIHGYLG
eukprot:CAMPEP_0201887700 /NCGR_PEP_ID=MMETSP0902-20130614/25654_1 /ASSEMBLY_ACC=CAM_ASM_000551 /TAXON_ID=420261 /ORGANISM="Thalassiosira antarctica, Strain CCMP982" /LENGTH=44 /DNA_ID= /DNA_START= /DNA_END= /DNA_ORIENTATION=